MLGAIGKTSCGLTTVRTVVQTCEKGKTMTEFISRNYGNKEFEVIIKTDSHEHYKETQDFARRLIDHAKPVTDINVGSKWIPVTERLPEEDGKYIVFEQSGGRTNTSMLRFAKDARKIDRYDFKGRWKNAWYEYDSEWGHYTVKSVTHWMPLPEPPKEE